MQIILQISIFCTFMCLTLAKPNPIDFHSDGYNANEYNTEQYYKPLEDDQQEDYKDTKYSFNYAVHDPHTGDIKHHNEESDGHVVKGSYSLKEADGSTRIVEYSADKHNGFNAKVHMIAGNNHEQNHY